MISRCLDDRNEKAITDNESRVIFALYDNMGGLEKKEKADIVKHIYSQKKGSKSNKHRMARLMLVAKVAGNMEDDLEIGEGTKGVGKFNPLSNTQTRYLGDFISDHAEEIDKILEPCIHNPDDAKMVIVVKKGAHNKYVIECYDQKKSFKEIADMINNGKVDNVSELLPKLDSEQRKELAVSLCKDDDSVSVLQNLVDLDESFGNIVVGTRNRNVVKKYLRFDTDRTVNHVIKKYKKKTNNKGKVRSAP